jgi:uncharacterized protein YdeI (YjbR/CyaY-like superfamily)
METVNGTRVFNPANRGEWRDWLEANYTSTEKVCVVLFHKSSKTPNITYEEAVLEALCFGWIDNKGMKRDEESSYLQFAPRKENGNWSMLNRDRVELLIKQGLMTPAGQVFIDIAKKNGKWDAALEADTIPADLQALFDKDDIIIQWINDAKRPETRQARVEKTAELAAQNIKSKMV